MLTNCVSGNAFNTAGAAVATTGEEGPPPLDPVKAAAEAQAEAQKLAQIEALQQMNIVRRWSVKISTHEDFEMIVFIIIFANIVTLAMYDPLKSDSHGYNFILDRIREPLRLLLWAYMHGGTHHCVTCKPTFATLIINSFVTQLCRLVWIGTLQLSARL